MTNGGTLSSLLDLEASLAIRGADDDANQDGKSGGDNQDQQGDKSGGSDSKGSQDGDKGGDAGKADKVELTDPNDIRAWNNFKEERDRLHGKVRTAESERDAAIKERDELKAKGATDDDAKQQMTALTTERDALLTTVSDLRVENSILRTSGYDWVDPDAVLRLVDVKSIDTDKNGAIVQSSLKAALDALAKDKPYLLKPKSTNDDKDGDKGDKGPKRSGDPAPQSRQSNNDKDKQARERSLRDKYPALRR